jgi:PAS domain S-box-containing protein
MAQAERIASFGVWKWELATGRVRWSDQLHRIYGLAPGEFAGTVEGFVSHLHPDDRERVWADVRRAIETLEPFLFEERIVRADGQERTLLSEGRVIVGDDGRAMALVGVCHDVTARAQAKRALGQSERRMRAIVDNTPSLITVKDLEGRYVMVNAECSRILGAPPDEIVGRRCSDLFPLQIADGQRRNDRLAAAEGKPVYDEALLEGDLGPRAYVTVTFALPDDQGLAAETCTIATDVTDRRLAEAELARLAGEQAALRRVATLVAKECLPAEVFAAVGDEVVKVFSNVECALVCDEGGDCVRVVAVSGPGASAVFPVGTRLLIDCHSLAVGVLREGQSRRIDDWTAAAGALAARAREHGIASAVGVPIVVRGRVWGAMVAARFDGGRCPPETETRIEQFADLVATAITNAETRAEAERLTEEQAALRRVATLVANGASATAVFDAVAAEIERLLDADQVALSRYELGGEVTVVAHRGLGAWPLPLDSRLSCPGDGAPATVGERPVRIERSHNDHNAVAEPNGRVDVRVAVAAPVVVENRQWGVIQAGWSRDDSLPANIEERIAQFAQLLDTAIANAESRANLIASRARLVAASDEARRRFERDLHDGVQQRLVSLALELQGTVTIARGGDETLIAQLAHVREGLVGALDDLRELSRGIHPAILSEGGLAPALRALARRSAVPVELDLGVGRRLDEHVEVGAYYVVSEALTNAAKHAHASKVRVHASADDVLLKITVDDDGVGGADPARGSGLTGLTDRVAALGGTIAIDSRRGKGTSLHVELPVDAQ